MLSHPAPPGDYEWSSPRDCLASKQAAWEDPDCTEEQDVWFSGKEGWEIEPDTWQGPRTGQQAGKAGLYSTPWLSRPAPCLGSWQRPEQASPCWGEVGVCGTGGSSPTGNEKPQRLAVAGLTVFCVLVFIVRGRLLSACQGLCDAQ